MAFVFISQQITNKITDLEYYLPMDLLHFFQLNTGRFCFLIDIHLSFKNKINTSVRAN